MGKKVIHLVLVVALCLLPHLAMAEISPGVAAYDAGDYARALTLLESEAPQGDPVAQTKLGLIHAKGLGVPRDPELALDWFQKAAARGHAEAEYCVGVVHDLGDGIPQDRAKAALWYRRAANKGFLKAQLNLANLYAHGDGVAKDLAEAALWYRKAAEQNDADAQRAIGLLYAYGEGLELNHLSAKMWIDRAAAQHDDAARKLAEAYAADFAEMVANDIIPRLAGGDGSNVEDAISFPDIKTEFAGVAAEYKVIRAFLPGWQKASQAVFDENGHIYDVIKLTKDGANRSIYFDITAWFGQLE